MVGWVGYEIETRQSADGGLVVELRGEFDLHSLDELKRCLMVAVGFRCAVVVDLSGVTFADVSTLRELAAYGHLYSHHLTLCDPSPMLLRSVGVCGIPDWFEFGSSATSATSALQSVPDQRKLGFAS